MDIKELSASDLEGISGGTETKQPINSLRELEHSPFFDYLLKYSLEYKTRYHPTRTEAVHAITHEAHKRGYRLSKSAENAFYNKYRDTI